LFLAATLTAPNPAFALRQINAGLESSPVHQELRNRLGIPQDIGTGAQRETRKTGGLEETFTWTSAMDGLGVLDLSLPLAIGQAVSSAKARSIWLSLSGDETLKIGDVMPLQGSIGILPDEIAAQIAIPLYARVPPGSFGAKRVVFMRQADVAQLLVHLKHARHQVARVVAPDDAIVDQIAEAIRLLGQASNFDSDVDPAGPALVLGRAERSSAPAPLRTPAVPSASTASAELLSFLASLDAASVDVIDVPVGDTSTNVQLTPAQVRTGAQSGVLHFDGSHEALTFQDQAVAQAAYALQKLQKDGEPAAYLVNQAVNQPSELAPDALLARILGGLKVQRSPDTTRLTFQILSDSPTEEASLQPAVSEAHPLRGPEELTWQDQVIFRVQLYSTSAGTVSFYTYRTLTGKSWLPLGAIAGEHNPERSLSFGVRYADGSFSTSFRASDAGESRLAILIEPDNSVEVDFDVSQGVLQDFSPPGAGLEERGWVRTGPDRYVAVVPTDSATLTLSGRVLADRGLTLPPDWARLDITRFNGQSVADVIQELGRLEVDGDDSVVLDGAVFVDDTHVWAAMPLSDSLPAVISLDQGTLDQLAAAALARLFQISRALKEPLIIQSITIEYKEGQAYLHIQA